MKRNMQDMSVFVKGVAVALALVSLPCCDFFKKKEEVATTESPKAAGEDVILCRINDKPAITKCDFDKRINQILQANPYFRGAGADMLPPQVKQNVFNQLVNEEVLIRDADENKIEDDAEFKKTYSETKNLLKRSIKVQLSEKKVFDKIQINDEEVKDYFEKNKARYVKVAGGVLTSGVRFDTEVSANAFLAEAKAKIADFENLGKKSKAGKFKEFGRISNESMGGMEMTPAPIKEAVLAVSNLPTVQKVKVGKEIWIIKAADKIAPVYYELNEIKDQLVAMLKNNKFKDEYNNVIRGLKTKYNVSTNDEFFKATPDAGKDEEAGVAGVKSEGNDEGTTESSDEAADKNAESSTTAA